MSSHLETPEAVARVATIMSGFGANWLLCGGWAADSALGRLTRDHHDIDITVFHEDQRALFEHLAGWQLVGHDDNVADDSSEPWLGRELHLPAHIHALPPGSAPADPSTGQGTGFNLEVILNERSGDEWLFSREPRISLPLSRCVVQSPWGEEVASPEVVVFYKALPPAWRNGPRTPLRKRDERDFAALLPQLSGEHRRWLHDSISLIEPAHPWLPRLRE